MKTLGDFDYGFADRLRGIRYKGTGPDNKTYSDWLDEAADLLDECEKYVKAQQCGCENQISDFTCARCATLAKLREEQVNE